MSDDEIELLTEKMKWLHLTAMAKTARDMLETAANKNLSFLQLLHRLCDEERQDRIHRAIERRVKAARFPEINTIDAFNFDFDPASPHFHKLIVAPCR